MLGNKGNLVRPLTRLEAIKAKAVHDYQNWLKEMTPKLAQNQGPLFLGGMMNPFIANPGYKPFPRIPRISFKAVTQMLSCGHSHTSISKRSNMSIERVHAIETLKQLKEKLIEEVCLV